MSTLGSVGGCGGGEVTFSGEDFENDAEPVVRLSLSTEVLSLDSYRLAEFAKLVRKAGKWLREAELCQAVDHR